MKVDIKPNEWTEISKGNCTVWGGGASGLIRFRSNDVEIASSYLVKPLKLTSEFPIEAKSNRLPLSISIDKPVEVKEKVIEKPKPVKKTKAKPKKKEEDE